MNADHLPWLDVPSIYDHLVRNINPVAGMLSKEGQQLPDEERRYSGAQLRWIPGGRDGAFGHHGNTKQKSETVERVSQYILEIASKNSEKAKIELYQILLHDELVSFIDGALREIISSGAQPTIELHEFALFLARSAPDRGPVKVAIALLGLIGDVSDINLVSFLGKHEEFTLYSAVALSNMLENPEKELWALAKFVDGWGRIHIVERLASTSSPEIKDWLLREGYKNRVMYEYTAYHCAVGGDLRAALLAENVDEQLLTAAGEMIEALINGGPAKDIKDYADSADVLLRYLHLLEERASTVEHYLVADSILGFLSEGWDMEVNRKNGWTFENRDQAIVLANHILQKSFWRAVVEKALTAKEYKDFYRATRAADLLGLETWDLFWERLNENPLGNTWWFFVMTKVNKERIDQVIALAESVLPLEQIATGSANEMGFGPRYKVHRCLETVVQYLGRFPGKGWLLIAASLKSPVISNRTLALRDLAAWGKDRWPEGTKQALFEAEQQETEQDVKDKIEQLLREGKIED